MQYWKTQNELIENFKAYPIVYNHINELSFYLRNTIDIRTHIICFILLPCSSCLKHLFKLLSFQFNFFFSFQFKRIFNNTRK